MYPNRSAIMKKLTSLSIILSLLTATATPAPAGTPAAPPKADPPAAPATPAPDAPIPGEFKPEDLEGLKPHVGKTVTIKGTVDNIGASEKKGLVFVNFHRQFYKAASVVVTSTPEKVGEAQKELQQKLPGREVKVTGTLSEYKNRLQIQVADATAIEVSAP
jgi:predicted extracellular nuclease